MPETLQPVVIDVRSIPKPQRHPLIFEAMDTLEVGQSVIVKNDHNPIPLRGQVEAIYGAQFDWHYLEEGPELFRLQFTRREPAPQGWNRSSAHTAQNSLPILATSSNAAPPLAIDLLERLANPTHSGPQWAHECEDLDLTLLAWEPGKNIAAHVNSEVDVVFIGVAGQGHVLVNGEVHELRPGMVLLIPKGCERAIESAEEPFSYLSVHRRRRGLMPTWDSGPNARQR